jgi:hypothetical protein
MEHALVVDRKGLAKKLASRPKVFIFWELIQNAIDENVTRVTIEAEHQPKLRWARITVSDDAPDGFADLTSVYTLFKDSKKGPDPEKRGRFELGEKLVIASALKATVTSTRGTITIDGDTRTSSRKKTAQGSVFQGEFRMTTEEFGEALATVKMLLVPAGVEVLVNGVAIGRRLPIATFEAVLPTVRTDDEGELRPTMRKTRVSVYEPLPGEEPHIYEMGIPVVSTTDRYHYDIEQRVPVNFERNNVPPAYLRTLRVFALNHLSDKLTGADATSAWVDDALSDERVDAEPLKRILAERFGERAVIHDPSDPEGTKLAMSQGYAVVHGGSLSREAWQNVRRHEALLPAGQVTPSPRTYDPEGMPENVLAKTEWTERMQKRARFAQSLYDELTGGRTLVVVIVIEPLVGWSANLGPLDPHTTRLCLNLGRLGHEWFAKAHSDREVLSLLIHEFGHDQDGSGDHLSREYHRAVCDIGARLTSLALDTPELFEDYG